MQEKEKVLYQKNEEFLEKNKEISTEKLKYKETLSTISTALENSHQAVSDLSESEIIEIR